MSVGTTPEASTGGGAHRTPAASHRAEMNTVIPRKHPGRWIAVGIIAILAMQAVQVVLTNPNFHWDVFLEYLLHPQILRGVRWTLLLTVLSMALAIVIAGALVAMRDSDNPVLQWAAYSWIWFFRGTPIYTQLVFWGLFAALFPRIGVSIPFGPELFGVDSRLVLTPAVAALLGLGLNESAYLAEIFRAGFNSIDRGQSEAAQALGMRPTRIWRRILLPQAMRVIIPPTGNETIGMLKMTSLVLAVPFTLDLTFATNAIANRIFLPVPLLMVAAFWYLVITSILMVGQYYLERRFGRGVAPRAGESA